ncbi:helix-turn-helix domain-containing protein [Dysgonomonas sp. Marseille-P4677]|uniref:hybrid sensor histidine kinase/response regulator transcription factor n=1 Tax=Dysgonomonas sp. Marseille-P4677 TaxID=2364790 RepID=UPI0019142103|nr:two-component regulator propeller domain-containing protein [Dysgonomonas sp. Marseille-P4677]MBK5719358.1 helix-turn-helix domain-containing protein [Dysgonomonas sp. Marseille-P4677]
MKKPLYYILYIILPFIYFENINAFNLRQISNRDGLSNSAILSICQDNDGFMWFGSCDGLNMFNGINIQVYKPTNNENKLSGNLIENIIEAENGILWVYTNYGLDRFDKKRRAIESFNQFKGQYFIQKDRDNNIFIIKEDNCIYYYHKATKSFKKIVLKGLVYESIINITITSDNLLWIFTKNSYNQSYKINIGDDGDIHLTLAHRLEHNNSILYCLHEKGKNDVIYFIDNTRTLYEYHLIEKKKYYITNLSQKIEQNGEITSIVKYHNDFFIGFKTNGLLRLKNVPDKEQNYIAEDIGIKCGIFCLLKDKYQDLLWIGTDGQGVYMYSNNTYSIKSVLFNTFTNKIEKPARALYLDKEQSLWIGTKGDGILKFQNYTPDKPLSDIPVKYYTAENSTLKDNSIFTFAKSSRNILWIGGENGINYYSYKDKEIRNIEANVDGVPIKYVHAIHEANDTTLWIATVGTGIVKAKISGSENSPTLKGTNRLTIHGAKGMYNFFFTLYKENETAIWFGNRGYGAIRVDTRDLSTSTLLLDNSGNNQTLNDIFSIVKDSNDNFWFGTSFGLVKHTKNGENVIYNEANGFPNNTIHGILKDSKNNLWLSTNNGIVKFDTENEDFQVYNNLNGLQVTEFSDGASFYDETTATIFFGGINGFVSFTETETPQQEYLPKIYFDNLSIFGKEKNISDFIENRHDRNILNLNYNQNFFSISFTALDYINGNNYSYFYKLDNLGTQWIENGSSNSASFTNLSPGTYTLSIKYKNRLTGNESPAYSITIKILPPWYMSWWAYVIYILAIFACITLLIKTMIEKDRKRKLETLKKIKQQHQEEVYESKLSFFTNIAHEFCTPLTLIYGPCDRILSHSGSDRFVRKYTQLIQRNAERLNDLIQDLIEFRRIETGNKLPQIESLQIAAIVNDISSSFYDLSESNNIEFICNISEPLIWNSDKGFIYTIITNLVSNAFKYTPVDGQIRIDVAIQDGILQIIVCNTGKGIKEKDLNHIFDRYSILDNFENQDVKNNSSRNGLGLAICNSMVKLLGGTIKVNSELNKETEFIVSLPEKEVSIAQNEINNIYPELNRRKDYEPSIELPEYEFDKSKPTILIIDDDIEILWFINEIFANEYNTIPVNKPLEVENILLKMHPDIIICDVMMPAIDGIALAKTIKADKKTAHIPMILVSAKHAVEEQIEGLASGAEMYITKPFNVDYLATSVKHLISRKETLKDYFHSPLSAYDLSEGKMTHKENTKFIQDILDIIEKNITNKKLSAQFIADELNMSPRHLYRKLSEINSDSPTDMIKDSRLHIARNLLINTKLTIDEIIYKSGFSNRATFFRSFSQKFGCTPKEYRDKEISDL